MVNCFLVFILLIFSYLRKYGKYGIPFNIVYDPCASKGIIFGETLGKRDVMNVLSEAAGK